MPRPRPRDVVPDTFGINLRYYRDRAGLTLTQLAAASGIHYTNLSRWETGSRNHKRGPAMVTLHRLAAALGCTEAQLRWPAGRT